MKLRINIDGAQGYDADQATKNGSTITVGDLRSWLDDYDDDDEIVTYDTSNTYGAAWGRILPYGAIEPADDGDEAQSEAWTA